MTGSRGWRLVRASTEAIPASVRRFNQRARRRRLRAVAPWFAVLVVLALLGLVAVVLVATPLLGVRQVRVIGAVTVSADQVRQAASIDRGSPLATLDTGGIARRVGALPPVLHVAVDRDWPATVIITITERTAVAVLDRPDKRVDLIDARGVVFRTLPKAPAGLPRLELDTPGPRDPCTLAALSVLGMLTGKLRDQLVALSAPAPTRISLVLADHRRIVWGDATRNADKVRVALVLLGHTDEVIDVSAPDRPTVG